MAWFLVYGYPLGSYAGMPGNELPGGPPGHAGQPLPGWDRPPPSWSGGWIPQRPDNSLPWAPVRPGQGLPGWERPTDPGYGMGGGLYPGNWVPGQGLPPLPGNALPGRDRPADPGYGQGNAPNRPDAGLPGDQPGMDQGLPGTVHMGEVFIVAYHPSRGLHWVKVSDITKPDAGLPGGAPPVAGQPLPPAAGTKPSTPPPATAGQPLPPGAPPVAGQPLPPAAQPKR